VRVDDLGWLEYGVGDPRVIRYSTPRTTSLEVPAPLGIVWHWTAGKGGPGFAPALAKEIGGYDPKKDRAASWHVLIAKDGTLHQSASFTRGTWHVGRPGVVSGYKSVNVNRCSVGCELENAGRLLKLGARFFVWPYFLDPDATPLERKPDPRLEVDSSRAVLGEGDFWPGKEGGYFDAFTREQEESACALVRALASSYEWTPAACGYGHVMFDPSRREDPGPLWLRGALPRILAAAFPPAPPCPSSPPSEPSP